MVRLLLALALFAHGIGHVLFVANAWGYWRTETGAGWFFTSVFDAGQTAEGFFGLLWLVSLAGFVGGAWGYFSHAPGWQPLLLASAAVSAVLILLWWGGINTASAVLALVFNLIVIALILWQGEHAAIPG
jgi:hypothetical protein